MPDILPYKGQVYEVLKNQHNSSELFFDTEFPAEYLSLSHSGKSIMGSGRYVQEIFWRRPKEICTNPQFEVEGFKCGDLDQGELGDCWFIAAANSLALQSNLRERTVPLDQSFDGDDYAGIFHFRFWLYGQWYDVVIDDQLPCDPNTGLIFCRNNYEKNEMWGPLLEKAYAKLCGSYEAIEGGRIEPALIDLTGGIGEVVRFSERRAQVSDWKNDITQVIRQACEHKSLLGCSLSSSTFGGEERLANGLFRGHAYTITRVADVTTDSGSVTLIKCLNPWGNHEEWKGNFSDTSQAWNEISDEEKQRLGLKERGDGKFWMSSGDFITNFAEVVICHQELASFETNRNSSGVDKLTWKEAMFHGEWIPGVNAGGCGNDRPENFWKNPQYLVTVSLADDSNHDQLCTMIISLMLKIPHERRLRHDEDRICYRFDVYKVLDENQAQERLEQGSFKFQQKQLKRIKDTGNYVNSHAVSLRIEAEPGSYVIIPSTFHPYTKAEFLLRVFTEASVEGGEVGKNSNDTMGVIDDGIEDEDRQPSNPHSDWDSSASPWHEERRLNDDDRDDPRASGTNSDCSIM